MSRSELAARFERLADEVLLRRYGSGDPARKNGECELSADDEFDAPFSDEAPGKI